MRYIITVKSLRLLFLAFLFLSGCSGLPPADPQQSQHLHEEATRQTFLKNYPAAIELYREAIRYAPQNSILYRQQAEIFETTLNFKEAKDTYELALKRIPANHPDRETILYRYGLLLARDPGYHQQAKKIARKLSGQAHALDLKGMVALSSENPAKALALFSKALQQTIDADQQARIYYHAAMAHYQRDDSGAGGNALFHAVNNARSLALREHIKLLFETKH